MTGYDPDKFRDLALSQEYSIQARVDIKPEAFATWDDDLLREPRVCVPIDVQALVVPPGAPAGTEGVALVGVLSPGSGAGDSGGSLDGGRGPRSRHRARAVRAARAPSGRSPPALGFARRPAARDAGRPVERAASARVRPVGHRRRPRHGSAARPVARPAPAGPGRGHRRRRVPRVGARRRDRSGLGPSRVDRRPGRPRRRRGARNARRSAGRPDRRRGRHADLDGGLRRFRSQVRLPRPADGPHRRSNPRRDAARRAGGGAGHVHRRRLVVAGRPGPAGRDPRHGKPRPTPGLAGLDAAASSRHRRRPARRRARRRHREARVRGTGADRPRRLLRRRPRHEGRSRTAVRAGVGVRPRAARGKTTEPARYVPPKAAATAGGIDTAPRMRGRRARHRGRRRPGHGGRPPPRAGRRRDGPGRAPVRRPGRHGRSAQRVRDSGSAARSSSASSSGS